MQLIHELAAGVDGAESGSVEFYRYGSTSTVITAYADDTGESILSTPYTLSSTGSIIAYVDELCTVIVKNSAGVEVSRFVPKTDAALVSLNSSGFTGELSDGSTGIGGTTDILSAMDLLSESFGAPNFLVRRSGSTVDETLVAAFASLGSTQSIYNIKNYGAVIDGATDDSAAWNAAIAAASVAGGIVFHPGGDSYIASSVALVSPKVSILGTSGGYARITFPSGIGYALAVNLGTSNETRSWIKAIGFSAGSAVTSGAISLNNCNGFTVEDCVLDVIAGTSNSIIQLGSRIVFKTCRFDTAAGSRISFNGTGASYTTFIGCEGGTNFQWFTGLIDCAGITNISWVGGRTYAALVGQSGVYPYNVSRWSAVGMTCSFGTLAVFADATSTFLDLGNNLVHGSANIIAWAGGTPVIPNGSGLVTSTNSRQQAWGITANGSGSVFGPWGGYKTYFFTVTGAYTLTLEQGASYAQLGDEVNVIVHNTSGGVAVLAVNAAYWQLTGAPINIPAGQRLRIKFVCVDYGVLRQLTAALNF